jgi:predicted nucleotidyltransferase
MYKIYETIVGSRSYGLNRENSDTDIKGVYIQPLNDVLGFKYKEHEIISADTTYYEVRKFIELLGKANPTILEMLWIKDDFVLKTSQAFEYIKNNRQFFLTKACQHSYLGYTFQQLKRFPEHQDYKNLMHTCRLCHAARSIAENKKMIVYIDDVAFRDFLFDIRDQKISFGEVKKWVENEALHIKQDFEKSDLPDSVNVGVIHDLLVTIRNRYSPV